jgi:hypothetical protein
VTVNLNTTLWPSPRAEQAYQLHDGVPHSASIAKQIRVVSGEGHESAAQQLDIVDWRRHRHVGELGLQERMK